MLNRTKQQRALAVLIVMGAVAYCPASLQSPSPLWFDETNGGAGFGTFGQMADAYGSFISNTNDVIGFSELGVGTKLSNQYSAEYGVMFENTANGRYKNYSRVRSEGDGISENITGYDGTFRPSGDHVFAKFDNDLADTPFTICFDEPVAEIGAFVGMGVQGSVHSLTISLFNAGGSLLDQKVVESWLWDGNSKKQNYESFFAARFNSPEIARVEIRNNATKNFANALLIDEISFGSGAVPEPSTLGLLIVGAAALVAHRRRQHRCG